MSLQIQIPWHLDLVFAGYWGGTFFFFSLGLLFCFSLCKAKTYPQSLTLESGQNHYFCFSFLPYLPSQTHLEFCWLCQLEKQIGNGVPFLWQSLSVPKNALSLVSVVQQGARTQSWFPHPLLQLVFCVHPGARNPLPGLPALGCSSVLPLASACCHIPYLHCFVPIFSSFP